MKNEQIKYRQWTGDGWHYWGFIDGVFVAPIQGIEESDQLLPFPDKNGKEIYEGDIINFDDLDVNIPEGKKQSTIWEAVPVVYNKFEMRFAADTWDGKKQFYRGYTEVIGNKKENPELLNQ